MISLIIPTRDRASLLQKALCSLLEQTLPTDQFEVLVVDNGSQDHTARVVAELAEELPNLRYCHEPRPGLHAGRHRGLSEARHDILVFADDDIRATPTWLEAVAENFQDKDLALLGGNNYPDFAGPVPDWLDQLWQDSVRNERGLGYLSILALPEGRRNFDPHLVWGCNFAIRRQVLLAAGGFHPDSMPKELIRFRGDGESHVSNYVAQQRLTCRFDSRASVYHMVTPERMTFDYFRQRAFNQGISDSYTRLRNREQLVTKVSQPAVSTLRKSLRSIKRRLVSGFSTGRLGEAVPADGIDLLVKQAYREGFAYHQQAYDQDPEVQSWVHKANYY